MGRTRVIIQCRTTSSRLPAKAFLPLKGIPAVILCAKRAMNQGADVVVATSNDCSDDNLVELLQSNNITCIRGSLEDVLDRYVQASNNLQNDDYIVRLTADNVFPDGEFINELIDFAVTNKFNYCRTDSMANGLPYGLGCEIFTFGLLKEANTYSHTAYEREHVTPWMRTNAKDNIYYYKHSYDLSFTRATLDTIDDHILLMDIFKNIQDPINVSWRKLCDELANISKKPSFNTIKKNQALPISELTLGTVQIGTRYGITNKSDMMSEKEALVLVSNARELGVKSFDCARGYGMAENRLGKAFGLKNQVTIITKLSPDFEKNSNKHNAINFVRASIYQSCYELKVKEIDVLMIHRFWQYEDLAIWNELLNLRDQGVIKNIGISISTVEEAAIALKDKNIKYIQLPFNLIDWRWQEKNLQDLLFMRQDVTIFARSVFLQGLLISEPSQWPDKFKQEAKTVHHSLAELVIKLNRKNIADLCISYVRAQPWIDSLVIGCLNVNHLQENVSLFHEPILSTEECKYVRDKIPHCEETLLNPGLW
ncbi:MAG: aldo/keto reductase [Candidatus Berkiella sp.]